MTEGLTDAIPLSTYAPWAFLFASALLATCVDTFSRRMFHPVVVCVWFFSLAFSGSLGGWGPLPLAAGVVVLVAPHILVCMFAPKLSRPVQRELPEPTVDVDPPVRLVTVGKPRKTGHRPATRRAA